MTSYFVYEKDFSGRWNPVCFFDYKPDKRGANGEGPERSTFWVVPDSCLDEFGEPLFGKLQEMFKI